jgi:hypothetical protein
LALSVEIQIAGFCREPLENFIATGYREARALQLRRTTSFGRSSGVWRTEK